MQISDKTVAQYLKENGDTLHFRLGVCGLEGIIIPTEDSFNIVVENKLEYFDSMYTVKEFLTSDYRNYLSFYQGYDGFSDFKITEEGKFRNFDGKKESTLEELRKEIWLNNIKRKDVGWINVCDIFPFNRIEVDGDGIHIRKKGVKIKNGVEYLIHDSFDNSFGFYNGDGEFVCSFMEFVKPNENKFIYVNLGLYTILFYEKAYSVEPSRQVINYSASGHTLQYTTEGFFTMVDLLKNFKELLECERKFVSVCRQSKALIKE